MKPPYDGDSRLAWENYVVVQVAQAALGMLGARIRAVSCRVHDAGVDLHFVVADATDVEREDIEDVAFELDALLDGRVAIETFLHGADADFDWATPPLRGVYAAKPDA